MAPVKNAVPVAAKGLEQAGLRARFSRAMLETAKFIEDHSYDASIYRNTGRRSPVSDVSGRPGREESAHHPWQRHMQ